MQQNMQLLSVSPLLPPPAPMVLPVGFCAAWGLCHLLACWGLWGILDTVFLWLFFYELWCSIWVALSVGGDSGKSHTVLRQSHVFRTLWLLSLALWAARLGCLMFVVEKCATDLLQKRALEHLDERVLWRCLFLWRLRFLSAIAVALFTAGS